MYTIVTSLNKKYWDLGAETNIKSWDKNFPKDVNIHIYTEDNIQADTSDRVIWHDLYSSCPTLPAYIEQHKDNPHYNGQKAKKPQHVFKWNAVKFAHKTFPLFAQAKKENRWLIWLDTDVLCVESFDHEFLKLTCPQWSAISYLGRPSSHSECGFVGYNMSDPLARDFMNRFETLYTDSHLDSVEQTHDSFVFDYVRKQFEQKQFFNMNAHSTSDKHPFHSSVLRTKLVHNKGTNKTRKQQKFIKRYKLENEY